MLDKNIGKDGDFMNEDSILKAYMDKVDSEQRELHTEMREREERINRSITDSEQRKNEKLDRIEMLIYDHERKLAHETDNIQYKMHMLEEKMNKLDNKFEEIKHDKVLIIIGIATIAIAGCSLLISLYQMFNGGVPLLAG